MNEVVFFYILLGLFILLVILFLVLDAKEKNRLIERTSQDLNPEDDQPSKTYFSRKYRLVGKPDETFAYGGTEIPKEYKGSYAKDQAYPSHILQLAAYCLLIEDHFGKRPPYGKIVYKNEKEFTIKYTKELRASLLTTMKNMRAENPEEALPPICEDTRKCKHCGYAYICHTDQKRLF